LVTDFPALSIVKNGFTSQSLGIDFNDATTPIQFDLYIDDTKKSNLSINCPPGELIIPYHLSENEFNKNQRKN
jgi:hypothetical protein